MQGTSVRSPQRTTAKGTAYAGQENMLFGRSKNWASMCVQNESRFQWKPDSGVYYHEQRNYSIKTPL
ncbi:hypothetical protein TNCV_2438221 [Trichonephila clavipes]|nr:hypothetical protein TNCV_2438221 [Trichonephila clavipes]